MPRFVAFGVVLASLIAAFVATRHRTDDTGAPPVTSPAVAPGTWFRPCPSSPNGQPKALPAGLVDSVPPPHITPPPSSTRWPTNQWWTSLLTPKAQPLWAPPLVVQVIDEGLGIGVPIVGGAPDAVISAPIVDLTVHIEHDSFQVLGFGDFHVVAQLSAAGQAEATFTVAQGSLATWVTTDDPVVSVRQGSTISFDRGEVTAVPTPTTDHVWVDQPDGRRWDLITSRPVTWSVTDAGLLAGGSDVTLGLVARPDGADANVWGDRAYASGLDPVIDTIAEWQFVPGSVRQRLTYRRLRNGAGAVAVLPHQQGSLIRSEPVTGTFTSHLGTIDVQMSDTIEWAAPLPGVLLGAPKLTLPPAATVPIGDAVRSIAEAAVAVGSIEPAGSYFGPKELGRLASTLDVSVAISASESESLQQSLTERLDRWLTASSAPDDRWLGYDPVWGGVSASSPEFGHEDYNDHHFQYGYLVQAAATVAGLDSSAAARWRPVIDLLAADLGLSCDDGFPRIRVVNPYLGHSVASGMVPFVDGVNQESSSEALHAWWAFARWAAAVGDSTLSASALAMYAMEAQAARTYWLGEGVDRPTGYAHDVAGIVWGGKIDFATFFDARPASVVGIQLLPFTFGSLYRSDPNAAAARYDAGSAASGERWQDLLAMDLALSDPTSAATIIDGVATSDDGFEEGVSEAFARYWVSALATLGSLDRSVVSDPPIGLAFRGSGGSTTYVATNASATPVRVSFSRDGSEVAILDVPARSSVTENGS